MKTEPPAVRKARRTLDRLEQADRLRRIAHLSAVKARVALREALAAREATQDFYEIHDREVWARQREQLEAEVARMLLAR